MQEEVRGNGSEKKKPSVAGFYYYILTALAQLEEVYLGMVQLLRQECNHAYRAQK